MTAAPVLPAPKPIGRHRVRDTLEGQILTGQRAPGSKLRQHELARELNTAVPVIREALLELRALGLVDMVDNHGAYVSTLTHQRLIESFDIREALEGIAARRCCERITRMQVRELEALAEEIYACSMGGRLEEANRLDRQLHERLIHISGNGLMACLLHQYRWATKVIWSYHDPAQTRRTHLEVLQAIGENRPDDAERLMREHIRFGCDIAERRLAENPSELHWIPRSNPTSSTSVSTSSQEGL